MSDEELFEKFRTDFAYDMGDSPYRYAKAAFLAGLAEGRKAAMERVKQLMVECDEAKPTYDQSWYMLEAAIKKEMEGL